MPDCASVTIAEAVKDSLNAGTFSATFTAERAYDLTAELQDNGLHVHVAIREESGEVFDRASTEDVIAIDVAVRMKCDTSAVTVPDQLMYLLEELKDSFVAKRLDTDAGDAWCYGWARTPAYYQQHMRDFRQFTGLLTLQFKLARDF